jgi:L-fucose isomerase-like protein
MDANKTAFALFFGNRSVFPGSLIAGAREELARVLQEMGHPFLMMPEEATRFGAVETAREGELYANFLQANRGRFGGVILSLPNFGDETGAVAALKEAGVPILVQAYPDEPDKLGPDCRRDAFCGKLSVMDVFNQYGVRFTALKPHVVWPGSAQFRQNVADFDRICRVANGLRKLVVGAIGARTTPFKTVRIDEVTLQRYGITVETIDLAEVIARARAISAGSEAYQAKAERLRGYSSWEGVPESAFAGIARLGVVLDEIIAEYRMDAVAIRCWSELQRQLGVSACVLLSELNSRGIPAACEVDIGSAVAMQALHLASGSPGACLDWNNNYGDEAEKCILFHCGPLPKELMTGEMQISDNPILAKTLGTGCSFGCNVGRILPGEFTFSNLMTEAGRVKTYIGTGRFTTDPIAADFFGVAGVAEICQLEDVLLHIGRQGHRHHVGITRSCVQEPLVEALSKYLNIEVTTPQNGSRFGVPHQVLN